jgi:hypothetical protein
MKQVCYLPKIPDNKVVNLKGLIDKPFDFKWYDIYINGRKLVKKDVEIISANLIRILKTESLQGLEIVENSRDKEYFGGFENIMFDIIDDLYEKDETFSGSLDDSVANDDNIKDDEDSIVETPVTALEYLIRAFYDFLLNSFGLLNPDELQLSRNNVRQFAALFDENEPFRLGFDNLGNNQSKEKIPMHINPDK